MLTVEILQVAHTLATTKQMVSGLTEMSPEFLLSE